MKDSTNIAVAVVLLLTLLITALVYWPGLSGPFLLDDILNIKNAYVGSFDFDEVYYAITHNTSGIFGRPVSVLSLLFSGIAHGPDPWGYKFHNLAIHLINGLLIFWLLIKLMPRLAPLQSRERQLLIPGIVAVIWLLHPLLVSTVLYAVQRMAQLSSLFILTALIAYVQAREKIAVPGLHYYLIAYVVLPLCTALSILSKENGALIPFYLLATELVVFRFEIPSVQVRNRLGWLMGIFVVFPVLAGSIYFLTHLEEFVNFSTRNFNMVERLMTQLHVIAAYLKMILLPRLSDMTLFHDYVEVTRSFDYVTAILLAILAGSVFLVFYLREKAPILAFSIAWFLVSHLLESTIFSLELMFEHRNYLAAVGPLFAMVYYLFNVDAIPKLKYLSGIFLLLVTMLTIMRVQEWRSEELIYQVAVAEHPDSTRVQSQMANYKFNQGDIEGALAHLAIAQKNSPEEFGPVLHEIVIRCASNSDVQPLLDEAIRRAKLFPITTYSMNAITNLLVLLNTNSCPVMNLDGLMSVIEAAEGQPGNQESTTLMGLLEQAKGQIFLLKGDYSKGIEFALSSYEKTDMTIILSNLARNLIQLRLLEDAEQIILILENIDEESGGRESALIMPLREALRNAIRQQNIIRESADVEEQ